MMFWHIYVTDNRILQQPDVRQQAADLLSSCPILRFRRDIGGKIMEEPPGMTDAQLAYWVPLRLLLSKPGTADRCPAIRVQRFGRPVLPDFPSLFISISHSGHFTVLSVSDVLSGIDLQEIRPVRPNVAERFFTAADRNMLLSSATDAARGSLFFRLWTIREALGIEAMMVPSSLSRSAALFSTSSGLRRCSSTSAKRIKSKACP